MCVIVYIEFLHARLQADERDFSLGLHKKQP